MSPLAFALRTYQRWRRGNDVMVASRTHATDDGREVIDLEIDVPAAKAGELRVRITDTVVRIAEALRSPDDVYHQIYRQPGIDETTVLPVGPLLQELGDRLSTALGHGPLAGRTVVWLTLPRSVAPAGLVDPFEYDPERGGEPQALMRHEQVRWSFATTFVRAGPSVAYRVLFFVPADAVPKTEMLLQRLRS
jgi:hypothetical protein